MNSKPQPLYVPPVRNVCPVCGSVSYSASGVHPQCAMEQWDAERMKRIKLRCKSPKKAKASTSTSPWQSICPKCKAIVHIRKKVCSCGHSLARTNHP